jgi:hypothetical protein
MEREIMPEYAAEAFYRYLIPQNIFGGSEELKKEAKPCVVSRNNVCLNLFENKNQERESVGAQFCVSKKVSHAVGTLNQERRFLC